MGASGMPPCRGYHSHGAIAKRTGYPSQEHPTLNRTTLNRLVAVVALATLSVPALNRTLGAQDRPKPAGAAAAADTFPANKPIASTAAAPSKPDVAKDPSKVVLTVGNEK